MAFSELVNLAQRALLLAVLVSLPVLVVAAAIGLVTAMLQAATQIHDAALSHLPRFLAIAFVLVLAGPWMGRQILSFTLYTFGSP